MARSTRGFDRNKISQFIRDANEMIVLLGEYVSIPETEQDEENSGEMRRLRVVAAALTAACDAIGRAGMPGPVPHYTPASMPRMPTLEPPPTPVPSPAPSSPPIPQQQETT